MGEYPDIDRLEAPLREAHSRDGRGDTFQAFVKRLRVAPDHHLHRTAVAYNREMYLMQNGLRVKCADPWEFDPWKD